LTRNADPSAVSLTPGSSNDGPSRPPADKALEELGYDDGFAASFRSLQSLSGPGAVAGRVLRVDRTACQVALASGELSLPTARDLQRDPLEAPTTGDWVVVAGGEVAAVLERRTSVMRAGFRDLSAHVLAANVDSVLVVSSLQNAFRPRRIERLLVIAWQTGGLPVVVLTKSDCCEDVAAALEQAAAVAPGVAVHAVSAVTGEGMDELLAELAPRTTAVMIGPSGTGKSTLANSLSGGTAVLATTDVRSDGKGRHTTVTRELVRLVNGALLIDTPGLRAIGLWDAGEALGDAFSDLGALAADCRFNDCAHQSEPGCAVRAAVGSGALDPERLESFKRLEREQRRLEARTDARLRAERRAELRSFGKSVKNQFHR
jgi:ribosome biogenesis GTPase